MNTDRTTDKIRMNADKGKFLHKDLTSKILKAAFEVHNTLGCGFLEKVYENALMVEPKKQGIECESQEKMEVNYKGERIGDYIADIIVEGKVIVEVKTAQNINSIHKAQVLNYLKATGLEVGLLLNFANSRLEYKRLALTHELE